MKLPYEMWETNWPAHTYIFESWNSISQIRWLDIPINLLFTLSKFWQFQDLKPATRWAPKNTLPDIEFSFFDLSSLNYTAYLILFQPVPVAKTRTPNPNLASPSSESSDEVEPPLPASSSTSSKGLSNAPNTQMCIPERSSRKGNWKKPVWPVEQKKAN